MEKRKYVKPTLSGEEFIPQNYIAACGDSGAVYKFKCDAGGGTTGTVYYETNGIPGLQKSSGCNCGGYHMSKEGEFLGVSWSCSNWVNQADEYRTSSFHACVNDKNTQGIHEANSTSDFINGYYVVNGNVTPVIIWKGANNDNVHCTTALDINSWETTKS